MTAAESLDSPQAAIARFADALAGRASPGVERVPLADARGRVLAEPIVADRDSPPLDVSAMDGYAVRAEDCRAPLPVVGAMRIGTEPPPLPASSALRIVTGGAMPAGADAVVRHEDVELLDGRIRSREPIRAGANVRRRGENLRAGASALPAGSILGPAAIGLLASFGVESAPVRARLAVAIVVTGDELVDIGATPQPWQLRDSNGAALASLFASPAWLRVASCARARDTRESLHFAIASALASCDALVLTGGVSMGESDLVAESLVAAGATPLFHRVAQRPGRPMFGAVSSARQPIFALPGNPVSAMVTARRIAIPVLRALAGAPPETHAPVTLRERDSATIPLWWHRCVTIGADGNADLVSGRGSGDVVHAGRSDGFVEIPPSESGCGPWPYFAWGA